MRIDIRCRDIEGAGDVSGHAQRRLRFALSRFEVRIRRVRVTVEDVNGPKGGVDKRCTVVVSGGWTDKPVVASTEAADWQEAVDRACDAAARAVARGLARRQLSYVARAPGERSATGRALPDV